VWNTLGLQSQYTCLEDKYNKAKKLIRGMQEREREVVVKIRHREAGFHTLLQVIGRFFHPNSTPLEGHRQTDGLLVLPLPQSSMFWRLCLAWFMEQALQQRMQLLERHLVEAQTAAGMPVVVPPAPHVPPTTLGLLSAALIEPSAAVDDVDLEELGIERDPSLVTEIKEEFDKVSLSNVILCLFLFFLLKISFATRLTGSNGTAITHVDK